MKGRPLETRIFIPPIAGEPCGEYVHILRAGCRTHPGVTVHVDPESADYILLDFRHFGEASGCWDMKRFPEKTILADYSDSPDLLSPAAADTRYYFKRSVVRYTRGGIPSFIDYPREIVPISYAIKQAYSERAVRPRKDDPRPIDVSCFFKPGWAVRFCREAVARRIKSPSARYRKNTNEWIRRVGVTGQTGVQGRNNFQKAYFDQMQQSRVVVTCNLVPNWEGDYRLFEALSSGAMVMVNTMLTPVKNRFIDGAHLVYFSDLDDLERKLYYYLENEDQRLEVARAGFDHAARHHKVSDRIEEMLESARSQPRKS